MTLLHLNLYVNFSPHFHAWRFFFLFLYLSVRPLTFSPVLLHNKTYKILTCFYNSFRGLWFMNLICVRLEVRRSGCWWQAVNYQIHAHTSLDEGILACTKPEV